jgi:hypothetical protein
VPAASEFFFFEKTPLAHMNQNQPIVLWDDDEGMCSQVESTMVRALYGPSSPSARHRIRLQCVSGKWRCAPKSLPSHSPITIYAISCLLCNLLLPGSLKCGEQRSRWSPRPCLGRPSSRLNLSRKSKATSVATAAISVARDTTARRRQPSP